MSPQIERLIQLLFATPANFVTRRDRLTYYRIEPEMRWISASALDRWAGTQIGRADVVELVARLIWATAPALYSFRFPSGDAGQLPGFDGHLITPDDFVHPFVPAGESVWEFGTGKDYLNKAQSDYKNRTNDPGPVVPSACAFVFVTPRIWDQTKFGPIDWEKQKLAEGKWKKVVAIDAVSLEHWLDGHDAVAKDSESRISGLTQTDGVRSMREFWEDYADRFDPRLKRESTTLCTSERGGRSG